MSLLCKLFGHKVSGHAEPGDSYTRYFKAEYGAVDGINRHHIRLYADCDRCHINFHVGNIHGTPDGNILSNNKHKPK